MAKTLVHPLACRELTSDSRRCALVYDYRVEGMDFSDSIVWNRQPQESCTIEHPESIVWNLVYGVPDIGPLFANGTLAVSETGEGLKDSGKN
jgi:hypothetical protein